MVEMEFKVVNVPVADVDRARRFYLNLGWRLGGLALRDHLRQGCHEGRTGPVQDLMLIVDDIDAARDGLISRDADVSEVFHYESRPFHSAGTEARLPGPDQQGRSYFTWTSFGDPDRNGWLLQEITRGYPRRPVGIVAS